jgi:hypothetical protein
MECVGKFLVACLTHTYYSRDIQLAGVGRKEEPECAWGITDSFASSYRDPRIGLVE